MSPWARALAAVAAWGASFVAVQLALEAFTPLGLVAGRMLLAATVLGLVQRGRGGALLPSAASRGRVLTLGVVLGVHMALQAVGLLSTTAVHTGWIIAAIPAVIAVGARVVLHQRLSLRGWGGVVLASLGVLLVLGVSPADLAPTHAGDGLQLASCVTWAIYTLAASGVVARDGALRVTLGTSAVAGLVCLPPALFTGLFHRAPGLEPLLAFGFLALACSAMANLFWYQVLAALGPVRTGAVLYVQPLFTLAASALVLGEAGDGASLLGGVVVLLGVWLVQRGTPGPSS